jgi:hypothetical protein
VQFSGGDILFSSVVTMRMLLLDVVQKNTAEVSTTFCGFIDPVVCD